MPDLNEKHEAVLRKAAAAIKARGHEGDARLADSVLGVIQSLTAEKQAARRQHGSAAQAVGYVREVQYSGIARNGVAFEAVLYEGGKFSDNDQLFTAPPVADAAAPSRAQINEWMKEAGWQNSALRQADLEGVEKVVRAALSRRPAAEQPAAAGNALTDEVPHLIFFDDRDRAPEMVIGRERVLKRYEQISASWNAHLFVKIDSSSRDCKHPNATDQHLRAAPQAAPDNSVGFSLQLTREQWGIVTDGLILEIDRCEQRKQANSASNSDETANMARGIVKAIKAAATIAPQAAQGEGLTDEKLSDLIENAEGMRVYDGEYRIDGSDLMKLARAIAAHTRAAGQDGKDGERLDWLIDNYVRCSSLDMSGNHAWSGVGRYIGRGNTAREAIDAAMQQAASNSAEGAHGEAK